MQKQFCLATEPWIKVIDLQGEVRELSLKSTLLRRMKSAAWQGNCQTRTLLSCDFC